MTVDRLPYTVLLAVLLTVCSTAQPVLWHRSPSSNLGPAMQVVTDPAGRIFASVYQKGIYRSVDSGATWTQVAPYTDGLWMAAAAPAGALIASLWSRGVFRSTDAGTTWLPLPENKKHADLRAVDAEGTIFIEAEGKLQRSSDDGSTWNVLPIGAGVIALNGDTLFAAKGTSVYRSSDQGVQWSFHSSLNSSVYALNVSPFGSITAGTYQTEQTSAPSIYSFHSGTNSWNGSGPPATINALLRRGETMIFAASHDSGFYASTDNGSNWVQINNGLSVTKIFSLAFLADTIIVAGTLDGVFLTKNLPKILAVGEGRPGKLAAPPAFRLDQNFPNPFNPSTTITFSLRTSSDVTLTVSDMLGRQAVLLVNGRREAGEHSVRWNAEGFAGGLYLYTLRTGASSATKKLLLLR